MAKNCRLCRGLGRVGMGQSLAVHGISLEPDRHRVDTLSRNVANGFRLGSLRTERFYRVLRIALLFALQKKFARKRKRLMDAGGVFQNDGVRTGAYFWSLRLVRRKSAKG